MTPNCQSEIAAVAVARPVRPGESSPGLHPSESPGEWWLDVVGKGRKLRRIAVSPQAIEALLAYGATLGMPPELQDWPRGVPVLRTLGDGAWRPLKANPEKRLSLSNSQIYRSLKAFFSWAADKMSNAHDRDHLKAASTHWLRHTHATLLLENDEDITVVQENLGHSSVVVTAVYTHANQKARKAAINKLANLGKR